MKRRVLFVGSIVAVICILPLANKLVPTRAALRPSMLRPSIEIVNASGQPLDSLFLGLHPNSAWAHGNFPKLKIGSCKAKNGAIDRLLAKSGIEVVAHAQSSCSADSGFCYGCPNLDDITPKGATLFTGSCGAECASGRSSQYIASGSSPDSSVGYTFTGTTACRPNNDSCPCALRYCDNCYDVGP